MNAAAVARLTEGDRAALLSLSATLADSQAECQEAVRIVLREVDSGEEILCRVEQTRGYFRVPTMVCAWLDEDTRSRVAPGLAMHIFGMKLFDDAVDGDTGISPTELVGAALAVCQRGTSLLAEEAPSVLNLVRELDASLLVVCRRMITAARRPPENVEEWTEAALGFGGDFLAMYARLACLAGARGEVAETAATVGRSLGLLIAMSDDWADYLQHDEREGNLRYIVGNDGARRRELLDTASLIAGQGVAAAKQLDPVTDLAPLVKLHLADLVSEVSGLGPVFVE